MYEYIPLIIAVAVFIEGTVEWFKANYRKNTSIWLALVLGIIAAVAIGFNPLDIFDVRGPIPYVALVFGYLMGG